MQLIRTNSSHSSMNFFLSISLIVFGLVNVFGQDLPPNSASSSWQMAQGSLSKEGVQILGGNILTPSLKWEYNTGFGAEGYPIIADVDNDGENDVVCIHSRTLYVLNGSTGALKYQKLLSYSNPAGICPIVTDIDGDLQNEIIVTTDSLLMVLNGSDGSVQWSRFVSPGYFISGSSPVVADFDFDGTMDIAVFVGYNGTIHAFNGTDGSDKWIFETLSTGTYTSTLGELATANIDSDAALEVVFSTFDGRLIALDGSTGLEEWTVNLTQNWAGWTPVITDVESDGIADIVLGNSVYYGSSGNLRWENTTNPYYNNSCVADLDLDGIKEIYYAWDSIYAFNALDGSSLWTIPLDHTTGPFAAGPIAVDLYGGNELELVVATSYDTITNKVYLVQYDGTLLWTHQTPGHSAEGYAVGDIDNDGCSEIVVNPDCCSGHYSIYAIDDPFSQQDCSLSITPEFSLEEQDETIVFQNNRNIIIRISNSSYEKHSILLYDSQGRVIEKVDVKINEGINIIEFTPPIISTGYYYVEISMGLSKKRKKLFYQSQ